MTPNRRQFNRAALSVCAGAFAAPRTSFAQQRLPTARPVSWLAEVQKPPAQIPEGVPKLLPLLVDPDRTPITTVQHWEQNQAYLRREWGNLIGMIERPTQIGREPRYEIRESDLVDGIVRRRIRYQTERDVETEAYLLMPHKPNQRLPGVVVLHSTTDDTIRQPAGLTSRTEADWGLELAKRGMVVICPRCFIWDDSPKRDWRARVDEHKRRHPRSRGIAKMLYDAQRAVDLLVSLNEVDPQRIGAAGHSLGAKEVLYLAAFDDRIRATVSSEGGIGTTFSNWEAPWYWGDKEFFGREHHELLAMVAPRAFLLIGGNASDGDQSWPFIDAVLPVYRFYGEPCPVGLYSHGQGHTIPPLAEQRTYEWLEAYLS